MLTALASFLLLSPLTLAAEPAVQITEIAVEEESGNRDIPLLRFTAESDDGELRLHRLVLEAETGDTSSYHEYSLWADTDGDGTADAPLRRFVSPIEKRIVFQGLRRERATMRDVIVTFEVRADRKGGRDDSLTLRLAPRFPRYLEIVRTDDRTMLKGFAVNGTCEGTCEIGIETLDVGLPESRGDLTITGGASPAPQQLLGGTLGNPIMDLTFTATAEAVELAGLQFRSIGNDALSVDRLDLYKNGNGKPFASATVAACGDERAGTGRTFCANIPDNALIVDPASPVVVHVRPSIRTDDNGGISGEEIRFLFRHWDTEVMSSTNTVVMSKAASVRLENPNNFDSLPLNDTELARLLVRSLPNDNVKEGRNAISLHDLVFTLQADNVRLQADDFEFYNERNENTRIRCTTSSSGSGTNLSGEITGSFRVSCLDISGSIDTQIPPDTEIAWILRGEVRTKAIDISKRSTLKISMEEIHWTDRDSAERARFTWMDLPEGEIALTYEN